MTSALISGFQLDNGDDYLGLSRKDKCKGFKMRTDFIMVNRRESAQLDALLNFDDLNKQLFVGLWLA